MKLGNLCKTAVLYAGLFLLAGCSSTGGTDKPKKPSGFISPVQKYGKIQVADYTDPATAATPRRQLCDEKGKPVQLRGMSSFGLQWADGAWILTGDVFDVLAYDWKCDVVRLAMYVTEEGYADKPAELLKKVEQGIKLANDRGLYIMVDWHILGPGNPNAPQYLNAGVDLPEYAEIRAAHPDYTGPQLFFAYLSQKYGDLPNIMWEIANEPNGNGTEGNQTDAWKNILLPYHQSVVDAIREYDKDGRANIIIAGTDNWSQFVDAPLAAPIVDETNQIMYTVHFYAGTHDAGYEDSPDYDPKSGNWLKTKILNALDGGLAVFATEWGTSLATGDGGPFIDFTERWLNFLNDNKISWCSWSLARKSEVSSSTLKNTSDHPKAGKGGIKSWDSDTELSTTGRFVRAAIRREAPPEYEDFAVMQNFEGGNLGNLALNNDSVNKDIAIAADTANKNGVVKLTGINKNGVWDNRLQFSSQAFLFGIYQNLMFDVYLPANKVNNADAAFTVKPVFQYAKNGKPDDMNYWGDAIPEITLNGSDFTPVKGTNLAKATAVIPIKPLLPVAKDTLEHLILLVSLTDATEGAVVYLDNLGFGSKHNGDIVYLPAIPDEPGTFVKLPFDFESGQREGWAKEGVSAVDYLSIRIENAETKALAFPVDFNGNNNEWEDGARLSSSHFSPSYLPLEESRKIKGITFDVYIQAGRMTKGSMKVNICPIPDGDGYWYQAGEFEITEKAGKPVTSPDGSKLLKYHVEKPLAANGAYPFTVRIRNLVLAIQSVQSDYKGQVFYDNIGFLK